MWGHLITESWLGKSCRRHPELNEGKAQQMKLSSRAGIPTEKGQRSQELMDLKPSLPDSTEILTTLLHLKKNTENWERLKGQNPSPAD